MRIAKKALDDDRFLARRRQDLHRPAYAAGIAIIEIRADRLAGAGLDEMLHPLAMQRLARGVPEHGLQHRPLPARAQGKSLHEKRQGIDEFAVGGRLVEERVRLARERRIVGPCPRPAAPAQHGIGRLGKGPCQPCRRNAPRSRLDSEGGRPQDAQPFEAVGAENARPHAPPHIGGDVVRRFAEGKVLRPRQDVTQQARAGERIAVAVVADEGAAIGRQNTASLEFHFHGKNADETGYRAVGADMDARAEAGVPAFGAEIERAEIVLEIGACRGAVLAQQPLENIRDSVNVTGLE